MSSPCRPRVADPGPADGALRIGRRLRPEQCLDRAAELEQRDRRRRRDRGDPPAQHAARRPAQPDPVRPAGQAHPGAHAGSRRRAGALRALPDAELPWAAERAERVDRRDRGRADIDVVGDLDDLRIRGSARTDAARRGRTTTSCSRPPWMRWRCSSEDYATSVVGAAPPQAGPGRAGAELAEPARRAARLPGSAQSRRIWPTGTATRRRLMGVVLKSRDRAVQRATGSGRAEAAVAARLLPGRRCIGCRRCRRLGSTRRLRWRASRPRSPTEPADVDVPRLEYGTTHFLASLPLVCDIAQANLARSRGRRFADLQGLRGGAVDRPVAPGKHDGLPGRRLATDSGDDLALVLGPGDVAEGEGA